ncbi:hypothetical protein AB432_018610 [Brevibacillus brevis]|uniref:DUF6575 domain-containing protein n=1 Tax=Brevibacillus brevis TaxID=1393 RepID=A0A2Z4MK94_BREBE|nr:DUF6575 domain-containing protein [Brevibacillus brevis]AWX56935.1 hypothetical protein AB432_018610 [Brevibacillus brevis]
MEIIHKNTIGEFKILETYIYFDGPQLFSCKSSTDQIYLCYWCEITDEELIWLYTPISLDRYEEIRSGKISVRDSILKVEDDYVWKLSMTIDGENSASERLHKENILEKWLPDVSLVINIEEDKEGEELATTEESNMSKFSSVLYNGKFKEILQRNEIEKANKQLSRFLSTA